jgi:hypothetical protein
MQSIVLAIALTLPIEKVQTALVARYGEAQRPRIERGVRQAAEFWRAEDGDAAAFEEFAATNFAPDGERLDALFTRLQFALESVDGHMAEISRDWKWQSDLDVGTVHPFDEIMAGYEPSAHLNEDLFANKLAHVVLLNFPLTTLDQRLQEGDRWSRRQWAEAKLALRFSRRVPSSVNVEIGRATAVASQFVATYNIWMHHVLGPKGERLFPEKMRLLEHWNLRDEIKADYSDAEHGIAKQRIIKRVMERIVDGTIPSVVVDNPRVDWNPFTNEVQPSAIVDYDAASLAPPSAAGEAPRYAMILTTFRAAKLADPYSPTAPTHIIRKFEEDRQLPEARVKKMLEEIVSSPLVPRVAKLIEQRLGRKLEPFDLWYNGFRPRAQYTDEQLDELVRKRYPSAEAYARDMPRLLEQLGFTKERAAYLAARIAVDPARGSGHALPSSHRQDKPRLRTRVAKEGMDYKGYNIAVHEMGHTVEEVFSLNDIDYYTLAGVPNNAFTEALAFVFQAKDLELLGLAKPSAEARSMQTLNDFWGTYEISGVALVEMEMWHWMYDHPEATPAQLRDATVRIAKDVWNRYYAPVFGERDVTLLGVYAHMVNYSMYLPDYPIGHMIAFQIEEQMEKAGNIGREFERMAKFGSVTPDLWMRHASGKPVGPEALLAATERALR